MATLTHYGRKKILIKTIGDERIGGLILLAFGSFFAGMGGYPLVHGRKDGFAEYALFTAFIVAGLAMIRFSLFPLFRSEWLSIDLFRHTYRGRRGVLFWGERLEGTLDHFEEIRMVDVPDREHPSGRRWVIAWIWKEDRHQPFVVTYWQRPTSFRLARPWTDGDRLDFLRKLRNMAKDTCLPLGIPKRFLDQLGVFDLPTEL